MQTQYQLLYRYINETTNMAITNEAEYEKTEEYYTKDHKINIDEEYLQELQDNGYVLYNPDNLSLEELAKTYNIEAESEKETMILDNMANQNKSNNLYVYTGTNKSFHKKFVPSTYGYLVRDWRAVPEEQIPTNKDDKTKHFIMMGGSKLGIDDAYLVCKPEYLKNYFSKAKIITANANLSGNIANNKKDLVENINSPLYTFFQIYDTTEYPEYDSVNYGINNRKSFFNITTDSVSPGGFTKATFYEGNGITKDDELYLSRMLRIISGGKGGTYTPINGTFVEKKINKYYFTFKDTEPTEFQQTHTFQTTYELSGKPYTYTSAGYDGYFYDSDAELYTTITLSESNFVMVPIDNYMADSIDDPYIIKDNYTNITLSPWISHSVHNSLKHALGAAEIIASKIGIDNVKLIKKVPIDRYIDIK